MATNINRVYVNPNFNRVSSRVMTSSDPTYSSNHLYVNPNFTRNATEVQHLNNLNRKIYVNPNFIKTTSTERIEVSESAIDVNYTAKSVEYSNSTNNGYTDSTTNQILKSQNVPARLSSKSRYHLVRRNEVKVLKTPPLTKEPCTVKITKYKSIPFHNFRNNLQTVKSDISKPMLPKSNINTSVPQYAHRNCFKLVRHNSKPISNTSLKSTPKCNSLKIQRNVDVKLQLKVKVLNRKKNNIPCRLFTKYGKCLRNLYGTCEYLHDKKHVSLCRKFIKGICHDKQCLLSHELSSKKMPTCFFYLKGMCTKEECPYLHVKLNEKSKICLDFLKGYCDKGDMCLHRHVRQQSGKTDYKKRYTLNKNTSNKIVKVNVSKVTKYLKRNQLRRISESKTVKTKLEDPHNENVVEGDCRYFKELQNKESTCEVLKPTRCKLGTLPSFISL